jgi:TolB protein
MRCIRFLALVSCGALISAITAAPAPKPGPQRRLVVSSNKDGNWDIYLVQAATGETKRLTESQFDNTQPVWSPDGARIAFVSRRENCSNLWLMNADGTGARAVTVKHTNCAHPRWSPDGTRIAFSSTKEGRPDVFVVEVATGAVTNLTTSKIACGEPEWSADGKKLSYTYYAGPAYTTRTVRANGTGHESLGGETAVDAVWSPVGARLAFAGWSAKLEAYQVFTANADGTNRKQLTRSANAFGGVCPQWSPDGSKLAYCEWAGGDLQVAVIASGGGEAKIVTVGHRHAYPRWSPDGRSLSYTRFEKGKPAVLVVSDTDGQNAKELITHVGTPAAEWKPK